MTDTRERMATIYRAVESHGYQLRTFQTDDGVVLRLFQARPLTVGAGAAVLALVDAVKVVNGVPLALLDRENDPVRKDKGVLEWKAQIGRKPITIEVWPFETAKPFLRPADPNEASTSDDRQSTGTPST